MTDAPWVVLPADADPANGEPLEVSLDWIRALSPKKAEHVAEATLRQIYTMDHADYQIYFTMGVLNESTDRVQDFVRAKRFGEGLKLLDQIWPVSYRVAHQRVAKTFNARVPFGGSNVE